MSSASEFGGSGQYCSLGKANLMRAGLPILVCTLLNDKSMGWPGLLTN